MKAKILYNLHCFVFFTVFNISDNRATIKTKIDCG